MQTSSANGVRLKKSKIKLTFKEYFEFLDQLEVLFGNKSKRRKFVEYKELNL